MSCGELVPVTLDPEVMLDAGGGTTQNPTTIMLSILVVHFGDLLRIPYHPTRIRPQSRQTTMDYNVNPYLSNAPDINYEDVVKRPLPWEDVGADTTDMEEGGTPLWWAARGGHEGAAQLLLEREDINPNEEDTEYGRTPLSWAARGGHNSVVILLLGQKDIDPHIADTKSGRTPPAWAAKRGHEGVVKALLQRVNINPNMAEMKTG
ncbi:ankyrin repeat-containing domain protein [Tuber brumale]|nr:ankyrin repeat-containing domain protein [Tuber brumale]